MPLPVFRSKIGIAALRHLRLQDAQRAFGQREQDGAAEPLQIMLVDRAIQPGPAEIVGQGLAGQRYPDAVRRMSVGRNRHQPVAAMPAHRLVPADDLRRRLHQQHALGRIDRAGEMAEQRPRQIAFDGGIQDAGQQPGHQLIGVVDRRRCLHARQSGGL